MLAFLDGKKTYIIAILAAVTAFAQALGYTVPEWVYAIEASLGAATLRAGVAKSGQ